MQEVLGRERRWRVRGSAGKPDVDAIHQRQLFFTDWSGHFTSWPPPRHHPLMPIQTIEPRRLYRQIADQLRKLIEHGEYEVGTRLPPERDLATQLGVSRPSVREALIALEVEGLVEVRM